MKLVRVGAAALNQTPLDWDGNARRIRWALDRAREQGVSLLCLPELCITGYGCEDAFLSVGVQRMALEVLHELLPATKSLVVSLGLPLFWHKSLFNTCCLVKDQTILGFVAKRVLAGDGLHYEPRWFKPWPAGKRGTVRLGKDRYPIGDLTFDLGGVKLGFEICEDAWTAERGVSERALSGVDVILNPSASHFAFGKHEIRRRLILEGARSFGASYVYANLLGNEAGRVVYDGDALVATHRRIEACAPRFCFTETSLVHAAVDVDLSRASYAWQSRGSVETAEQCIESEFDWPTVEPVPAAIDPATDGISKDEDFTSAMVLGLFDYLRKSRAKGFVVSLSGGADSAAVATLVSLMVRRGRAELGAQGFAEALPQIPELARAGSDRDCISQILITCYQSTKNSSLTTRQAAARVAEALGSHHLELDVQDLVDGYEQRVSAALSRSLDWQRDDLARQNIQARVRAPSVWMVANLTGSLLLATSNRSEAAVGYATMDGDTAGGLSPIAGIDKAFLLRWLAFMRDQGPRELGSIPALQVVTDQAPTAELRPPAAGQTDEADLMPYDILDKIERAAIRDKAVPREVYQRLRASYPELSKERAFAYVERFFVLWSRNQWKRERYAPSFHVDDADLDPRSWCRFPILSGGYARELASLRAEVLGPEGRC